MLALLDGTHWYGHNVGRSSTLLSLVKEAKQPDDAIRVAAFAVMQAVACHAWGVEVIPLYTSPSAKILIIFNSWWRNQTNSWIMFWIDQQSTPSKGR